MSDILGISANNLPISDLLNKNVTSSESKIEDLAKQLSGTSNNLNFKNIDEKQAMKYAKEFEVMLLKQFVDDMFKDIKQDDEFSGAGEDILRPLLSEEYAKAMAETVNLGVAKNIYKKIMEMNKMDNI